MVERGKKEQGVGQCRKSKEKRKDKSRGDVEEGVVKPDGKTDPEVAGDCRFHPRKYACSVESLTSLLIPSLVEKTGDPESLCPALPRPQPAELWGVRKGQGRRAAPTEPSLSSPAPDSALLSEHSEGYQACAVPTTAAWH